jgi:hypothetical protein
MKQEKAKGSQAPILTDWIIWFAKEWSARDSAPNEVNCEIIAALCLEDILQPYARKKHHGLIWEDQA